MTDRVSVPCGKCNDCCRGNEPITFVDDDDLKWFYENHRDKLMVMHDVNGYLCGTPDGKLVGLKRNEKGDCVFLDYESGCTVWENAPYICKQFDCRIAFLRHMSMTWAQRKRAIANIPGKAKAIKIGREMLEKHHL